MNRLLQAQEYVRNDYSLIPGRVDGKEPAHVLESWLPYRDRLPTDKELHTWFAKTRFNIAVLTEGLAVIDFDVKEKGREFYKKHGRQAFKTIVETRKGVHLAFRALDAGIPTQTLENGDLKANGGYVIWPFSHIVDQKTKQPWDYRFVEGHGLVPKAELPVIDLNWLDDLKPVALQRTQVQRGVIRDAIAYVMKVESAEGQTSMTRDNGLVRAISILRDSGMTEAEATVVMIDWNHSGKAIPPWPLNQLTRAISRTFTRGKR